MNTNPNQRPDRQYPQQGIDKTFVEGAASPQQQNPLFPELQPGTRVNSTSFQSGNPYTQTGGSQTRTGKVFAFPSEMLPSGNEPIPLGSGSVVGLLGTGGMAKVYKIWNEKLEVFRAVKILLPTQQADLKSRFETEAKITAKLHHPNIVEIYSVGDWNGLPFLEMEYIDGVSLESLIMTNGKLPNIVCSSIAILVARALEYAHGQEFLIYGKNYHGVIHRDLKPANIMIPRIGDVRLMDFGIARPTEASLHTVEGNIVGTMQYLSPEQMDGVDIDARTDIYSLGAILYEMLTGTKTFPQDTITNLMKKKIMNEYRKFSDFDFQVSNHLSRIAQKCLQINKTDRFSSASALLSELESAHRSMANEGPAKVLKRYLSNPAGFDDSDGKGFRFKISPKVVIPALGVLGIGALVTVFIVTGPKGDADEPIVAEHLAPVEKSLVTAQAAPVAPVTTLPEVPVKPPEEPIVKQPVYKPVKPPIKTPKTGGNQPTLSPSLPKPPDVVITTPVKEPVTSVKLSPIDDLKKKYNSDDLLTIGKNALRQRDIEDAIFALENVPSSHPDAVTKTLLLFDAYIISGKINEALSISSDESIVDAQFDYLSGRLFEQMNKSKRALEYYQTALTKPSVIRSRNEIRNDALFQTAVVWTSQHRANPSSDSRIQALNAWNTVKRTYMATPDHPRFKKANSELASIQ